MESNSGGTKPRARNGVARCNIDAGGNGNGGDTLDDAAAGGDVAGKQMAQLGDVSVHRQ